MKILSYRELRVYQSSVCLAMEIFELTKKIPPEEKYSLTDQIRRSSRSVCANIAEPWRKRRDKAAFIAKINFQKPKLVKLRFGLNWLNFVNISPKKKQMN